MLQYTNAESAIHPEGETMTAADSSSHRGSVPLMTFEASRVFVEGRRGVKIEIKHPRIVHDDGHTLAVNLMSGKYNVRKAWSDQLDQECDITCVITELNWCTRFLIYSVANQLRMMMGVEKIRLQGALVRRWWFNKGIDRLIPKERSSIGVMAEDSYA